MGMIELANNKYYDGTKLLSMRDLDGQVPEIYMCTSNRTAGKTTYFSRLLINRFLKKGDKFGLIYRYNYEISDAADKFFKDIQALFFRDYEMSAVALMKGAFAELFLNDMSCGYAISLNNADQLKKYSHLFSDIKTLFFDEFQSETNKYCKDEISKFISVHTSIARGHGEQTRYCPVYMCSNPVTILNPYYTAMGIGTRLKDDTKFLKGNGFVLEQGFNASAANAQKASAFNRAFASSLYTAYAAEGIYLRDKKIFIEKPEGKSRYVATIKYRDNLFGVREFPDKGIIYCDRKYDETFPMKLAVTTDDLDVNYITLKTNDFFLSQMRFYFSHGCFRFANLTCKEAIMTAISF